MSKRNADDVRIVSTGLSRNAQNWFCYGTLGDVCKVMQTLNCSVSIASKEIEKLVTNVIGLRQTGKVLEAAGVETKVVPEVSRQVVTPPTTSFSAIEKFKKRYGCNPAEPPKKITTKTNDKRNEIKTDTVNDFADIDKLLSVTNTEQDVVGQSAPQGKAGLIVASEKPFGCGFLKLTLVQEIEFVASGYGSVVELEGDAAVAAVEESCPDIGRFEVSKVLRFGDGIPSEKKDSVLDYFSNKYAPSPQWKRIVYYAGGDKFCFW